MNNILLDAIKLYYGLYDIQYKINNDYKKVNKQELEIIINYLNNENLADKCFNLCNETKYCKKISLDKCVPKCNLEDINCKKTKIIIKSKENNNYNDKSINSKYNGKTNYITKLIYIDIGLYIVIIKNNNYTIILFPSGYVYSKRKLEKYISFDKLYNEIFDHNNPNEKYILAGHSMGCVIIMILVTYSKLINNNNLQNRCYIIGSGAYLWCKDKEIINKFIKNYQNHYLFLGNGIEHNNKIIIDDYICKFYRENTFYSFPTILLLKKIKNNLLTNDFIIINDYFIIKYKKNIYTYYQKDNIITNIISKSESTFNKIELHAWNIYQDYIKKYINYYK